MNLVLISVDRFDTSDSITGSPREMMNSKNLIVSSVQDDFGEFSTIGCVKASATKESSFNTTGLTNPFVSNEQIIQKNSRIAG